MPGNTFSTWPMWEKLVFILACAVCLTMCLGFIKLGLSHYRLRKLRKAAEKRRGEQTSHNSISSIPNISCPDDNIPFGVRALESGVEIDGVWVSRSSSPEPTGRGSSEIFSAKFQSSRTSLVDTGQNNIIPTIQAHSYSRQTTDVVRGQTASGETTRSIRSNSVPSREPHLVNTAKNPGSSYYPPVSFARFRNTPYTLRPSSTTSTLEGLEAIHRASTRINTSSDSECSGSPEDSSSAESDPISAAAPDLLTGQSCIKKRRLSMDLGLLNNHRRSQVAETGQFEPRLRRTSPDIKASQELPSSLADQSCQLSRQSTMIPDMFDNSPPVESHFHPGMSLSESSGNGMGFLDVTPFTEFGLSSAYPASYGSKNVPIMAVSGTQDKAIQKPQPCSRTGQIQSTRGSFESIGTSDCRATRGRSGKFDVYGTGSFQSITFEGKLPQEHRSTSAPPISMYNRRRSESSSRVSQGKLRKRKRTRHSSADNQS